jgi:hypothetical protein
VIVNFLERVDGRHCVIVPVDGEPVVSHHQVLYLNLLRFEMRSVKQLRSPSTIDTVIDVVRVDDRGDREKVCSTCSHRPREGLFEGLQDQSSC